MPVTLGLDLGPNSIGWALVDDDAQRILAVGSRIFPEGVDNFDSAKEKSRNEARRIARGMRRQIRRRAARKKALRLALIEAGLWPKTADAERTLMAMDPYALRAQAADPAQPTLTPHELGRLLMHLNRRRGFLSNRKEKKDDTGSPRHESPDRHAAPRTRRTWPNAGPVPAREGPDPPP